MNFINHSTIQYNDGIYFDPDMGCYSISYINDDSYEVDESTGKKNYQRHLGVALTPTIILEINEAFEEEKKASELTSDDPKDHLQEAISKLSIKD
ncbi:hypothetical protein AYI70_g5726 [Smittium culicis]|uniref:Uncharacterized protein n=1 Tax=Smittium culicis TaxID=133412 RepID=A0A1R1XQA8_9FUNG|nr:hypothetical protein AYI70_g8072 [Smittium culicis]OMJ16784.1 hypothetical protein AYI70_g6392 [Smittium culicis]OMJ17825.1 hypothetical protein AYI70_g5726 [Smittium culicis]